MSEFKIIETQEQFDEAIKGRITRERESMAKKYVGYISPEDFQNKVKEKDDTINDLTSKLDEANSKINNHNQELAERDSQIKAYETDSVKTRIANELGLSYAAISFLQGEDEEAIRKSAETLKALVGTNDVAPLATNEVIPSNDEDAALKRTLKNLKGE